MLNSKATPAIAKLGAALFEGRQNTQQADALNKIAATADPYEALRNQTAAQIKQAQTNPTSISSIQNQINAIQAAQAAKDAAAGRRSNTATSSPAMLAAQSKAVQDYINSLNNTLVTTNDALKNSTNVATAASKYDTNSYISPLLALLGDDTRTTDLS